MMLQFYKHYAFPLGVGDYTQMWYVIYTSLELLDHQPLQAQFFILYSQYRYDAGASVTYFDTKRTDSLHAPWQLSEGILQPAEKPTAPHPYSVLC